MFPENLHLVPHVHPRQVRQVDHAHVHADASPLGCHTLRGHKAAPIRQTPVKAVRVAVGHHAHPRDALCGEPPPVADVRARLIGLGGADGGFQGRHRRVGDLGGHGVLLGVFVVGDGRLTGPVLSLIHI